MFKRIFALLVCVMVGQLYGMLDVEEEAKQAILQSALIDAVERNDIDKVKEVLKNGANINAVGRHGKTVLMYAICPHFNDSSDWRAFYRGPVSLDMVRLLLENKADINAIDEHGQNALMQAVTAGQPEVVKLLLEHGADDSIVDKDGKRVFDLEVYSGVARRRTDRPKIPILTKEIKGILLGHAAKKEAPPAPPAPRPNFTQSTAPASNAATNNQPVVSDADAQAEGLV